MHIAGIPRIPFIVWVVARYSQDRGSQVTVWVSHGHGMIVGLSAVFAYMKRDEWWVPLE